MAEALLEQYFAAWNEADAGRRAALLAECWGEGAVYSDPTAQVRGAAELAAHIGRVHAQYPGARLARTSAIDRHHDVLRFAWRMTLADGKGLPEGLDVVVLGGGKIASVTGFFGPLKPA
ncbi:MAG: nuclear transport factor 2 family protein [Betaproteobacteria bacterium]